MDVKEMTAEEENEYLFVLQKYYNLLFSLQADYDLRAYSHSDVWHGTAITIYHHIGRNKELVCKAEADTDTDAMKIAIRNLEHFIEQHIQTTSGQHKNMRTA